MQKKTLSVLLALSVLVNAFAGGFIAARLGGHPDGFPGPHGPGSFFEPAIASIDAPYRDIVRDIISAHEQQRKQAENGMEAHFDRLDAVVTAPQFDAAAFRAAIDALDAQGGAARAGMADIIVAIAAALPDDQRIRFFETMKDHRPRPGRPPR